MSKDEILEHDLYTIYKLIEIHAESNNQSNSSKKSSNANINENETYIDNIKF